MESYKSNYFLLFLLAIYVISLIFAVIHHDVPAKLSEHLIQTSSGTEAALNVFCMLFWSSLALVTFGIGVVIALEGERKKNKEIEPKLWKVFLYFYLVPVLTTFFSLPLVSDIFNSTSLQRMVYSLAIGQVFLLFFCIAHLGRITLTPKIEWERVKDISGVWYSLYFYSQRYLDPDSVVVQICIGVEIPGKLFEKPTTRLIKGKLDDGWDQELFQLLKHKDANYPFYEIIKFLNESEGYASMHRNIQILRQTMEQAAKKIIEDHRKSILRLRAREGWLYR